MSRSINPSCDPESCNKCGGKCTQVVQVGADGKETFTKVCLGSSPGGPDHDLSACHNFAVQLKKTPQPVRPQRQPQRTGRPMYGHASRTMRTFNPSHAMAAAAPSRQQKLVADAMERFPQGVIHGPGRPVRSGQICIIVEDVTHDKTYLCCMESGPQGDLTTCSPVDIVAPTTPEPSRGTPSSVRGRLKRRQRAQIIRDGAGPQRSSGCMACTACGGTCVWDPFEKKLTCPGASPKCLAAAMDIITQAGSPGGEPAAPCPPGWVLCPDGTCVESVQDCGLTIPPPPPQPSSGIRRVQAAMGGRLSNPRHGW